MLVFGADAETNARSIVSIDQRIKCCLFQTTVLGLRFEIWLGKGIRVRIKVRIVRARVRVQ